MKNIIFFLDKLCMHYSIIINFHMALRRSDSCSNFVLIVSGQEAVIECAHIIIDHIIKLISYPYMMVRYLSESNFSYADISLSSLLLIAFW